MSIMAVFSAPLLLSFSDKTFAHAGPVYKKGAKIEMTFAPLLVSSGRKGRKA
jgi:hypothetical protein